MFPDPIPDIPLQCLDSPLLQQKKLSLSILRTDQTDPLISGNKWFKLKYNLQAARQQGCKTLISFGGPYSNHLHALAAAGQTFGFKTIGIIRGEVHAPLNPTLSDVQSMGMRLYYIQRKDYRLKHDPAYLKILLKRLQDEQYLNAQETVYLMPEGGTNTLAIKGAAEIADGIPKTVDTVCLACGTGGTMAGIIHGLKDRQTRVVGFPALKGAQFLQQDIQNLLAQYDSAAVTRLPSWELQYHYHFGGFGKITPELARFITDFEKQYSIPLDPVYTAKMMYGIVQLIHNHYFPPHSRILVIHSGGLQGRRGMELQLKQAMTDQH